jgi:hypothetical protein
MSRFADFGNYRIAMPSPTLMVHGAHILRFDRLIAILDLTNFHATFLSFQRAILGINTIMSHFLIIRKFD